MTRKIKDTYANAKALRVVDQFGCVSSGRQLSFTKPTLHDNQDRKHRQKIPRAILLDRQQHFGYTQAGRRQGIGCRRWRWNAEEATGFNGQRLAAACDV